MLLKLFHLALHLIGRLHPRKVAATFVWAFSIVAAILRRRRDPRLTVAVDVSALWEPLTGVGWYLYRLLEHLADHPDLSLRLYGPTVVAIDELSSPVVEIPRGVAIEEVVYRVPEDMTLPRYYGLRLLQRLEPLLFALDGNHVRFAPNYFLPRRFRLGGGSLVAMVHDLGFRMVPWTLQAETFEELGRHLERTCFEAAHLLTPSFAVRAELERFGYAKRRRVSAVHHGPGHLAEVDAGSLPSAVPERYVLFVGTLEPRKNLETLLLAWQILASRGVEAPPLVICGRLGWKSEDLARRLREAEEQGLAQPLGYVEEGELATLYRRSFAVAFPTVYEGFGLPALEALAAGAPLLASDISVLREVAGESALYAPARDPAAWAARVEELLRQPELRETLAAAGRERARSFTWEASARTTAEVFRRASG
jgi:alpha-1,3-rhamnosyl/mannosyltransferase